MLQAGFEPSIPASEDTQTNALERVATGIDHKNTTLGNIQVLKENKKVRFVTKECI